MSIQKFKVVYSHKIVSMSLQLHQPEVKIMYTYCDQSMVKLVGIQNLPDKHELPHPFHSHLQAGNLQAGCLKQSFQKWQHCHPILASLDSQLSADLLS